MARLKTVGFELNSTTNLVETQTFDAASMSHVTGRTGGLALRCAAVANTPIATVQPISGDQTTIGYQRCYIRVPTGGLTNTATPILLFNNAAGTAVGYVQWRTNGALRVINQGAGQVGSDSAVLALDTWYRLELKCDATTNPGALEARLLECPGGVDPGGPGTTFASGANSAQGSWQRVRAGIGGTATGTIDVDDWGVNDSSGSVQNSWLGRGNVIYLRPNAAGDNNGLLKNGGGAGDTNNYTLVDEAPPNDATDYVQGQTSGMTDMYNMGASGLASTDTVQVVHVEGRTANITGAATDTAAKYQIEKDTGGTKTQSAAFSPNSTSWRTNNSASVIAPPITTYLDPDGAAWTQATLDSMQAGLTITTTGASRTIAMSALWVAVEYRTPLTRDLTHGASTSAAQTVPPTKTKTVTTPTATSTAQTVPPTKTPTLTTALSTSAAQALSYVKPIFATLTHAASTSAAQALDADKLATLTTTLSTSAAQALSYVKPIFASIVPGASTSSAEALSYVKPIFASIVPGASTSSAEALSYVKPIFKTLTHGASTSSAEALSYVKPIFASIVPGASTSSAEALAPIKAALLTPGASTSAAQALSYVKPIFATLTPGATTSQAIGLGINLPISITPATTTSSALTFAPIKTLTLAAANAASVAQALSYVKPIFTPITAALSTSSAPTLAPIKTLTVTAANAVSAAQAITYVKSIMVTLAPALTTSAAQAVTYVKPIFKTLAPSEAVAVAQSVGASKRATLSPAASTALAQALAVTKLGGIVPGESNSEALELDITGGKYFAHVRRTLYATYPRRTLTSSAGRVRRTLWPSPR